MKSNFCEKQNLNKRLDILIVSMFNRITRLFSYFSSYEVAFELDAIGYSVLKGHRIAISVTPSYFPAVWTPRKPTSVEISSGKLSIPEIDLKKSSFVPDLCPTPMFGPKMKVKTLKDPFYKRFLEYG